MVIRIVLLFRVAKTEAANLNDQSVSIIPARYVGVVYAELVGVLVSHRILSFQKKVAVAIVVDAIVNLETARCAVGEHDKLFTSSTEAALGIAVLMPTCAMEISDAKSSHSSNRSIIGG